MVFKEDTPNDVFVELVDLMFTSQRLVTTVGAAFAVAAATIAIDAHDPVVGVIGMLAGLVTIGRVLVIRTYNKGKKPLESVAAAKEWQRRYAIGGWTFSALVGVLGAWTYTNADPTYQVVSTTILFAYAAGMIVRVAVRPAVSTPQLAIALVPAILASLLRGGDLYLVLAGLQFTFLLAGLEMISYLHRTILGRLMSRRELARRANHDDLTGLPNRAFMRTRLDRACEQATRDGAAFAVLLLDLDGFKDVNDTLGHAAGDLLLREAARRMGAAVREPGFIARLGGDEFAAILPLSTDFASRIDKLSTWLIRTIETPYVIDDVPVSVGVSVGATVLDCDNARPDRIISQADRALYIAKAAGRGCFRLAGRDEETAPRTIPRATAA